eukprot:scaffold13704_cov102-Isochrysis_galbana.AAC.6
MPVTDAKRRRGEWRGKWRRGVSPGARSSICPFQSPAWTAAPPRPRPWPTSPNLLTALPWVHTPSAPVFEPLCPLHGEDELPVVERDTDVHHLAEALEVLPQLLRPPVHGHVFYHHGKVCRGERGAAVPASADAVPDGLEL